MFTSISTHSLCSLIIFLAAQESSTFSAAIPRGWWAGADHWVAEQESKEWGLEGVGCVDLQAHVACVKS